jgi:MraZ protein
VYIGVRLNDFGSKWHYKVVSPPPDCQSEPTTSGVAGSAVFIGHSKRVLDRKTLRLIVPSKLRDAVPPDELKDGFIAALGLDGCLALYTPGGWRKMAAQRVNMGEFDERSFQRMLFGTAERVHCDAQGRVVLPQSLVDLVGLGDEVVVAGAEDRIEIWPPKRWGEIESVQRLFYEQLAKAYYGHKEAPEGPAEPGPGRGAESRQRREESGRSGS